MSNVKTHKNVAQRVSLVMGGQSESCSLDTSRVAGSSILAVVAGMSAWVIVAVLLVVGLVGCRGKDSIPMESARLDPIRTLKAPFRVGEYFHPSGWMGDGVHGQVYVQLDVVTRGDSHPDDQDGTYMRIRYQPGPEGWAGLYFKYPDNNWGDESGIKIKGARKISFLARGSTGNEKVEFKAGGVLDQKKNYRDSFEKSAGFIRLEREWKRYEIDIRKENTSHVIGAFAWIVMHENNPTGIVFDLDDIWCQ